MNKILILGCTGMLGHVLIHELSKNRNMEVHGTARDISSLDDSFKNGINIHAGIEARDTAKIRNLLRKLKPDVVINSIGIIKQLPLASDFLASITINALFPHQVAEICGELNIRMIHVSTDCVFSGKTGNYVEGDFPDADDLYGRTKYLGEVKYPHCVTLRTSIIGHELKREYSLIEWFLSQESKIKGYTNVIYSGFPTVEMAHIILNYVIACPELSGLYQVSSDPISKYELLKLVAKKYNKPIEIEPFDEIRENKSLNSSTFRKITGYEPPSWQILVDKMYENYMQSPYYLK